MRRTARQLATRQAARVVRQRTIGRDTTPYGVRPLQLFLHFCTQKLRTSNRLDRGRAAVSPQISHTLLYHGTSTVPFHQPTGPGSSPSARSHVHTPSTPSCLLRSLVTTIDLTKALKRFGSPSYTRASPPSVIHPSRFLFSVILPLSHTATLLGV